MLAERPETGPELGRKLGVSKQRISDWARPPWKTPNPAALKRMAEVLGIPVEAWAVQPGAAVPTPTPASAPSAPAAGSETTLEEIEGLLTEIRRRRAEPTITVTERNRLSDDHLKLLNLKHRIEHRNALLHETIVRKHPHWAAIRTALLNALRAHPDALRAVVEALKGLGELADGALDDVPEEDAS